MISLVYNIVPYIMVVPFLSMQLFLQVVLVYKKRVCFINKLIIINDVFYHSIKIIKSTSISSIMKKNIHLSNIRLKFIISTINRAENLAICVSAERFGSGGNTIPGLELTGNGDWLQRYIS